MAIERFYFQIVDICKPNEGNDDDDDDDDGDDDDGDHDDDLSKLSYFVFFLDQGIRKFVAGEDLMPLPKQFVDKLPAQVLEQFLAW